MTTGQRGPGEFPEVSGQDGRWRRAGAPTLPWRISKTSALRAYEVDSDDPSLCSVTDQDFGDCVAVDEGELITLTLACEVPKVTGQDAEAAARDLESAGHGHSFDVRSAADRCTVLAQDPRGRDGACAECVAAELRRRLRAVLSAQRHQLDWLDDANPLDLGGWPPAGLDLL